MNKNKIKNLLIAGGVVKNKRGDTWQKFNDNLVEYKTKQGNYFYTLTEAVNSIKAFPDNFIVIIE